MLLQSVIVCDRYVLPIPSYPVWFALEYREELRKLPHLLSSPFSYAFILSFLE
jgi:hypothetical protein